MEKTKKMVSRSDIQWQNSFLNIQDSLKYMYEHSILCDVTIQAIDAKKGSIMCFSAHKMVLAMKSPVFADILFNKKKKGYIISVKNSPRAIDILLWYIYSDIVDGDDIGELIESFEAATTYNVFPFYEKCATKIQELSSNINVTNVCSVLKIADELKLGELRNTCFQFIKREPENIFLSDGFLTLGQDNVWELLKDSKFDIRHEKNVNTVLKWMTHNEVTDRKFLSIIDFASFSIDDFLNIVAEFPTVFSGQEIRHILSNQMLPPNQSKLPAWSKFSKSEEHMKNPLSKLQYEKMELVKKYAVKLRTDCNQQFRKCTLYNSYDFEHETLLKIIMERPRLKLIMIELAFGSEYVPENNLVIELHSNMNTEKKMQAVKYHLISSLHNHYLLLDDNCMSYSDNNFNLLLQIKVHGLNTWGANGPVSNLKYRFATVCSNADIKVDSEEIIQAARLKPFQDWLLLVNPESGEKKFIFSALFFDIQNNI